MKKDKVNITTIVNGEEIDITEALNKETEKPKPLVITAASIKEGLCNYSYEIKTGPGAGDKVARKGSSVVHDDLPDAFLRLKVHLAIVDDAFTNIEEISIDELEADEEITGRFFVTGFKVQGVDENEGIILIGEKYVRVGSIGLETPKISKSYTFFEELKEAIENAKYEVELYMNGKNAPKFEQGSFGFSESADHHDDGAFDNPAE